MACPAGHAALPIPDPVVAACRERLRMMHPDLVAAACCAARAAVCRSPPAGGETVAAAEAAVEVANAAAAAEAAVPVTLREVLCLQRAHAQLTYVQLQLAATGERLGQLGQYAGKRRASLRSMAPRQPIWDAPELQLVLAAARHSVLTQRAEAAEQAMQGVEAAIQRQEDIVAKLPV